LLDSPAWVSFDEERSDGVCRGEIIEAKWNIKGAKA
jgi:hypothetical protein